jgi:hypothetical protein
MYVKVCECHRDSIARRTNGRTGFSTENDENDILMKAKMMGGADVGRKASGEERRENYRKLCDLFRAAIPAADRFSVVYGFGVAVDTRDNWIFRKAAYMYSSYAVGFDEIAEEIVIFSVDRDIQQYGTPYYLKKADVKQTKYTKFTNECTIFTDAFPEKYIDFTVPEIIGRDPKKVCIVIQQEAEAQRFLDFFVHTYAK